MKHLVFFMFLIFQSDLYSQPIYYQYFDGNDTIPETSLRIYIDSTDTNNIWQIGSPQKTFLNSSASFPNVAITDSINIINYGDTSFLYVDIPTTNINSAIVALQWKHKFLFDSINHPNGSGGIIQVLIEDSIYSQWLNCAENYDIFLYNFFPSYYPGFELFNNYISISNQYEIGYTGQSDWVDNWMCFNKYSYNFQDTIKVRFGFISSDSANCEGWMLDNFNVHETWIHTIKENAADGNVFVYPTISSGDFKIKNKKIESKIEFIDVINNEGRIVKRLNSISDNYDLRLHELSDGNYKLFIKTEFETIIIEIVIQH